MSCPSTTGSKPPKKELKNEREWKKCIYIIVRTCIAHFNYLYLNFEIESNFVKFFCEFLLQAKYFKSKSVL